MEVYLSSSVFSKSLYSDGDIKRIVEPKKSPEKSSSSRSEWRKDYGRILHSPSFRRLQGKTQLFPNHENDFYRNRLTHSLEVAQIAKSIAMKINADYLKEDPNKIDLDIAELAALAHDIGHPPFGHNGETSLDECMRKIDGGFEGNAQTFRILSRLEKKETLSKNPKGEHVAIREGKDNRCGLNLTARSLAATLKYDKKIPARDGDRDEKGKVLKGYYECDESIVNFVKESVLGISSSEIQKRKIKFKTLECQIMDVADDIAYSTYDLEDALKAHFLNPLKLVSFKTDFYKQIADEIQKDLQSEYSSDQYKGGMLEFSASDVILTISQIFGQIFDVVKEKDVEKIIPFDIAGKVSYRAEEIAQNGYLRTDFTSDLVDMFIGGIVFEPNAEFPALSKVYLNPDTFKVVETLKKISYKSLIMSPMLKIAEYRGKGLIREIFDTLKKDNGYLLLPSDYRDLHTEATGETDKARIICDYISGMTDRYAIEFYNRLFGTTPESIHKPY